MSSITSPHSHSHPHSHNHNHASAADRNRAYFSSPDQIYLREKDFFDTFAANWTAEFLAHESWLDLTYTQPPQRSDHNDTNTQSLPQKQGLRMLDYACGPGMASFAALKLTPSIVVAGKDGSDEKIKTRFDDIIGVDVAEGMVSLFNQRVQSSSATNSDSVGEEKTKNKTNDEIPAVIHMQAYRGDLVSPSPASPSDSNTNEHSNDKAGQDTVSLAPEADPTDPQFFSFHLITCVAALHHFADPALAVAQLAKRLAPGGRLFVADMIPDSGKGSGSGSHEHAHEHSHTDAPGHGHHGHGHTHGSGHAHEDTGLVHDGFSQTAVEEMFARDGGLLNVKSRVMDLAMGMPASFGGGERTVFWVIGEKPTTMTAEMV